MPIHTLAVCLSVCLSVCPRAAVCRRSSQVSPGLVETEFYEAMHHTGSKDAVPSRTVTKGRKSRGADAFAFSDALDARDVVEAVLYMITAPEHCEVHDVLLRPRTALE